jgi:hypothetical protein
MNLDVLMNLDIKLILHVYEMRWQIYHLQHTGYNLRGKSGSK